MDQRADQLNDEGWSDDRSASMAGPGDERVVVDTVAYLEFDEDTETERIKADIEDTRAEMGQTLNEIQERLSPDYLMDQVKETVREATIGKVERVMETVNEKISNVTEPAMEAMGVAGEKLKETGSLVTNTIRRNPIPFTLVGLGVGMLIVNRVRNADRGRWLESRSREGFGEQGYGMATPRSRMGRSSGEYAGAARQCGSGRGAFGQVKHTATELMHGTTDTVSNLTHQAKEGAMRAGRGFQQLVEQNPLAVGAAAVAVGAAVGLMLPSTQIEHEYMGDASEKVVDRAQQVARDAMDKVKSATQGESGGQKMQQNQQQPGQQQSAQQPGQQPGQRPGQVKPPQGTPTA
jgi:ElaB/YqjD/DUF883 family membrane-anchored ribosome-binding protein